MARHHDRLEPLEDGFVGFHATDGTRWKHKDIEEGRVGSGHRLFVSDSGEERRYAFGPTEPHDATLLDLREQLTRATPVLNRSGNGSVASNGASIEASPGA